MSAKFTVEMPDGLLAEFLQHFRDFEQRHSEQHFRIFAEANSLSMEEIRRAIESVDPPLPLAEVMLKQ